MLRMTMARHSVVRTTNQVIHWVALKVLLVILVTIQLVSVVFSMTVSVNMITEVCLISDLKCYYDQILDIHFFAFSHTIGVSKISCQISIYYEQQNACFLNLYFREFTAAINFPCSKSGLRIGENEVIFSKIPHGLKL